MATPSAIPIEAERDQSSYLTRTTRGGRTLHYQLTVIQQPERARACGAGTKANSDRRPVDPPPVVELKIFDGPTIKDSKEITFDYNASFFLYASLEPSRKIAHGRMQGQPNPPILTGVPASGMAYLDRPTAAGYFIFPDLSVRHEGQYHLSFSLFETTKEEKDFDQDHKGDNVCPGVDYRMDIRTNPFDVFSAKKFPGLMQSTQLSKQVADQGCRVRIRRDVRMRKREGKSSGHERREEDIGRHRTVTPASEDPRIAARQRSLSASSDHRMAMPHDIQRRPSGMDRHAPQLPPSHEPPRGHLAFGENAQRYAAPQPQPYAQPLAAASPAKSRMPYQDIKPEYPYGPTRGMPQPPQPTPSQESHTRRPSVLPSYPPPSPAYSTAESHTRCNSSISHPTTPISAGSVGSERIPGSTGSRGPRLTDILLPEPGRATKTESEPRRANHTHSTVDYTSLTLAPIAPQTEPQAPAPPEVPVGGKRKLDDVSPQSDRPLHNHQRPQENDGYNRILYHDPKGGRYPRADGSWQWATFSTFKY